MIACAQVTDELRTYMKYEIEHTRNLYEEAKKAYHYFPEMHEFCRTSTCAVS